MSTILTLDATIEYLVEQGMPSLQFNYPSPKLKRLFSLYCTWFYDEICVLNVLVGRSLYYSRQHNKGSNTFKRLYHTTLLTYLNAMIQPLTPKT